MQINLKETEIAKAVELYLNLRGIKTDDKVMSIDFTMGKTPNGLSVKIDLEEAEGELVSQVKAVAETQTKQTRTVQDLITEHTASVQQDVREQFATQLAAVIDSAVETANILLADAPAPVIETPVPFLEERKALAEAPWETGEQQAFEQIINTVTPEPDITGAIEATEDNGLAIPDQAEEVPVEEVVAEPVAEPEPVVEAAPVRRPIFGKKQIAESAAAAMAVTLEEDMPVADAEAKPTLVRRSPTSLFKKPGA